MQLFVTEYKKKNTTIEIANLALLSQLRKVLRANIGDIIWIQSPKNEVQKIRYELRIELWDNKIVEWKILSEQLHESSPEQTKMIVSMPNKWEKAELIIQKLAEIGISEIIFWPSERSVIKQWNSKKEERLQKISKEAVEQSRGRKLPELIFTTKPKELVSTNPLVIFDKEHHSKENEGHMWSLDFLLRSEWQKHIYGLIWPEGGLTPKDYQTFAWTKYTIYGLGETVLRMETAAIVGWRLLKNNFEC